MKQLKCLTRPFLLLILIVSFYQCNSNKSSSTQGGIAITFDDQYISEWVKYSHLFDQYNIKATFFISRPYLLDSTKIAGLRFLEKKGHEIACHSYHHKNANDFENTIEKYYLEEIVPAINIFDSLGFNITSYAYPFGSSPHTIDSLLITKFKYLRKAIWNSQDTTLDYYNEIYASHDNHNILNSMGIDYNYNISMESVKLGIKRAKLNNEILIFHAHKIDTSRTDYTIHPSYLEKLFILCEESKISSFRIKDIDDYYQ